MKRHPNAVTSPPITAVRRVDFLRQTPMTRGEIRSETDADIELSQPERGEKTIVISFIINRVVP